MSSFDPTEVSGGDRVAWVTQGVVLYIERDLGSVWDELMAAWDRLLARPWASALCAFRRWDEPVWRPWDAQYAAWARTDARGHGAARRYWKVELADQARFATTSIDWQDVPASHVGKYPRASYLRVRLPLGIPHHELLEVTRLLCDALPIQQGVAGYLCHVDEASRGAGFDQAWAWARRYYGLHVVDPVEVTWDAPRGLWGVNWLTVVGARWLDDPLQNAALDALPAPLRVTRAKHGIVLQAGDQPTIGDLNRFDDLSAYTLASRALEPALIGDPTSLPGMFDDHESTTVWLRRFVDPSRWANSA